MNPVSRLVLLLVCTTSLLACTPVPMAKSSEQREYIEAIDACPLIFKVPADQTDITVERAIDWLVEYQGLPTTPGDKKAFKTLLTTSGNGILARRGYLVLLTRAGASTEVKVGHEPPGPFDSAEGMARNTHILSHFIRTGEIMKEMVAR
jgi:hypothetical protein